MSEKNVPNVRFKGFSESWEQRKLGEVSAFINGRAYKQDELLDHGKYKVLRVGNFYTNSSWYYSDLELDEKYYANKNDLLYTWSATFGPHIWTGEKVIYHYHIWKIILNAKMNKHFLYTLLEADKNRITANTNGSTMVHITKKNMEDKEVELPLTNEQEKIGFIFVKIDSIIASNQRKLDQLKKVKKLLMQKIFDQEWRFEGFTDPWEQRQLSEVVNIQGGGTPASNVQEYWNGKINWFTPTEVSNNGYLNRSLRKITEEGLKKSSAHLLPKGTILMTSRAGIGNMGILTEEAATNQGFQSLIPKEGVPSYFIYSLQPYISNIANKLASGSTFTEISNKTVKKIKLTIPNSDKEKNDVGTFFNRLDQLIASNQQKLDQLKEMKKWFMQNMFV